MRLHPPAPATQAWLVPRAAPTAVQTRSMMEWIDQVVAMLALVDTGEKPRYERPSHDVDKLLHFKKYLKEHWGFDHTYQGAPSHGAVPRRRQLKAAMFEFLTNTPPFNAVIWPTWE
jgi:hypothetical protein